MGILIITHHEQLLEHNHPDFTHVMLGGRIVETGGPELAAELHKQGYDRIRAAYPEAAADEEAMAAAACEKQLRRAVATGTITVVAAALRAFHYGVEPRED